MQMQSEHPNSTSHTSNWGAPEGPILPLRAVGRSQPIPLSFAQQRLWFLAQMNGASQAYHVPLGFWLIGELDSVALHHALDRLIARHQALRTSFEQVNGRPVQRIGPQDRGFALLDHDLSQCQDSEKKLEQLILEEASTRFDLQAGPPIRGRLIRLGDRQHVLLITMHHIVSDDWSVGVLIRELGILYRACSLGQPDPLPDLTIQYPDYAVWQRSWLTGQVLERHRNYWQRALTGAPDFLEIPADRRRPAQQDYAGGFVPLEVQEDVTAGLKALSRRHGATLFITLLAAWAALISRLSGQEDVVIGTPTANRSPADVEPLIGFFVNTLPMRVNLSGEPSVEELLLQVKSTTLEALQYQQFPFDQVVDIIRPSRSLAYTPLFQVVFAWDNTEVGHLELPGLTVTSIATPRLFAKFDLALTLAESGKRITGGLEYATALFDHGTVERYAGYFHRLLKAMVADDTQSVARVPLLGHNERQQLVHGRNATETKYPQEQCVHELFEAQVAETPEAVALIYESSQMTYAELNTRANRLAHYLRKLGVKPDALIAICAEPSIAMIVGLLAILKAGGGYVPLDPNNPPGRLIHMLKDSTPVAILTDAQARRRVPAGVGVVPGIPLINLDVDAEGWAQRPASNPDRTIVGVTSRHLAYVIYTSGSTGQPKGVMVTHRNVVSSTLARRDTYGKYGRFLLVSPISFDSSIAGIFGTLTSAGTLIISPADAVRDPSRLNADISRMRVETLLCVPSLYSQILEYSESDRCERSLSKIIVAGETCPPDLVRKSLKIQPNTLFFNEYGPTETTVWCSGWSADPALADSIEEYTSIPIGRPIPNTHIYILDKYGEPVPQGVAGEIVIGGAGVARGYLNRPDLTAERFVADRFAGEPGARMYKSGDIGRYLPDGNIEFLGRNDLQLKIRGFRIEPGEIESHVRQHPGVREATVLALDDQSGNKRLVAYVVPKDESADPTDELRELLKERLPQYMLPSAFVLLKTLPLTLNGKVDRRALPPPEQAAVNRIAPFLAPRDQLEIRLARLWEKLLQLPRVSVKDNFFDLGGDSLLAVRLVGQIEQQFGKRLPLPLFFETPTIEQLAQRLRQQGWSAPFSLLIPIQPKGSRAPFFCVHGGIGKLVNYVNREQPLYALQPYGLDGRAAPATVEEMAEGYIREIKLVQPNGPYFLGGFSAGALIMHEMAQQLRKEGQEIGLLVLLDPSEPRNPEFVNHRQTTARGSRSMLASFSSFMLRRWGDLRYSRFSEKFAYVRSRIQEAVSNAETVCYLNCAHRLPPHLREFYCRKTLRRIVQEYIPQTNVNPGRLILFKTRELSLGCQAGWERLSAAGLEIHEIRGEHLEIFDEPYVGSWATTLSSYLDSRIS
jgi:amino acid adenylation domain-containing protein